MQNAETGLLPGAGFCSRRTAPEHICERLYVCDAPDSVRFFISVNFTAFEARAREIFDGIPPEYREGVDGLVVERKAQPHPTLPEVYTLGECRSEYYPSEYGGPGDVHSVVVLFYGSFVALARLDEAWNWHEQLWETITHEIRHHLESLAAEDALEVQDNAEDQNFARREGEPFDPDFYRSGKDRGDGVFEVDGDLFVEREIESNSAELAVRLRWAGRELRVPIPEPLGDVHFLTLREADWEDSEVVLVLRRRRSAWKSLHSLVSGDSQEVLQSEVSVGVRR